MKILLIKYHLRSSIDDLQLERLLRAPSQEVTFDILQEYCQVQGHTYVSRTAAFRSSSSFTS